MSKKRFQITALAYDKRGKLLSVGRNSYVKTHPLAGYYGKKSGRPDAIYLHAELDALIRARGDVHKVVVMRYNAAGKPVNSKPCAGCQLALKDWGVKHVVHT